jgi:hypothetical protein
MIVGLLLAQPRSYEREDFVFNPLHYLALIEQKTNALDQAAPLANWKLPEEFATLRRLLEARMGKSGKRELPICPDLIYDRHRPRYRHLSGVTQPGRWRGT